MPFAQFPVVRIVCRRNFNDARTEFFVYISIGNNGNKAVGKRQFYLCADHVCIAFVVGMNGNRRIAQKSFGTGCRDFDTLRHPAFRIVDLIINMIHRAGSIFVFDFVIGKGGRTRGTPVYQIIAAVNQAALVKAHEHVTHRFGKTFIHRKALAAPIDRSAEFFQLVRNNCMVFVFYLPRTFKEFFAPQFVAVGTFLFKPAFHHVLRRDSRMVGARNPQRRPAVHALIADNNILQNIVERMPHVQNAGYVRRRNNDGKRLLRIVLCGLKTAFGFPPIV